MKVMRIHELREAAGLTQAQLAVQMGLTQSTICAWESEIYLPKARQLPALAKALGCEINDLFVDEADAPASIDYPNQDEPMEEE